MTREEYYKITVECPKCGGLMKYTGGLLGWECDKCGFEAEIDYNETNDEYYAVDHSDEDMPECCIVCGGAYPDCTTSCDIFDD